MHKIPVLGTVSRAYGFLIGDFVTILRLTWAPLLVATALYYYFGADVMQASQNSDPTRMMEYMPQSFLLGLVQFLAGIIAMVVLLRVVILGDRKPGLFVYLWFGSAEIRLVAVYILLFIAAIAAAIGFGILFTLLAALATQVAVLSILLVIAAIAFVIAMIWVVLRLSLIAPVIVAESGLGVERSWALMRGNALRMFLVLLLTFIPLAFAALFVFFVVLGSDFPPFPDFVAMSGEAGGREQVQEAFRQWQAKLTTAYVKHWLPLNALGFVYTMISTALTAGITGSAYVTVAGRPG